MLIGSCKCLQPSNCTAKNQAMDVVCAFVRIDDFQVHHVPDDVVLVNNAIAWETNTVIKVKEHASRLLATNAAHRFVANSCKPGAY